MRAKLVLIAALSILSEQCFGNEAVVGKSMSEATSLLGLELDKGSVITEPPAVARGLLFNPQQGVEIQLFVKRGQLPLTISGGVNLELFKGLEVIGFRKVEDDKVKCVGEVLWHFKC